MQAAGAIWPKLFVQCAKLNGLQQRGLFGDYAPASGAIQGILKSTSDAFTPDLEFQHEELSAVMG